MKLLEHQAKQRFARAGIPVPAGRLARTPAAAEAAAAELLGSAARVAVKAQVAIGGRGKAGGIAVVATPEEARREAERILGMAIRGFPVRSVLCEAGIDIAHELYLGITVDRERRRLVVMLSAAGGMDVEEVAATQPERIARFWPDPLRGPQPFELRTLAFAALHQEPELAAVAGLGGRLAGIAMVLHRLACELDAVTCEINPLVVTGDGRLLAADGKMEIDENAEHRHPDVAAELAAELAEDLAARAEGGRVTAVGGDATAAAVGDATAAAVGTAASPVAAVGAAASPVAAGEDPYEAEARRRGLTYVHLPGGTIGCIANGAGLAMNTLDLVEQMGGRPNNFLDIGGGASADKVTESLDMILLDPDVRGVLVNIFGGITRGDEVARGIIAARDRLGLTMPLVVRMTGTNEEEGRRLLREAGIVPTATAPEAARAIVALTGGPEASPAAARRGS